MSKDKGPRKNTYFRQTPSSFKADKQTQVFMHIKMNIPYSVFIFTKEKLAHIVDKTRKHVTFLRSKLPPYAKRITTKK